MPSSWRAGRVPGATRRPGCTPAAGERMAREQPALHFLYREIEALNGVDRAAVLSGLIALRTTPPAALAVLSMPVLCVVGEEDAVIPPDSVAILASRIPGPGWSAFLPRGTRSTSSAPRRSMASLTTSCPRTDVASRRASAANDRPA